MRKIRICNKAILFAILAAASLGIPSGCAQATELPEAATEVETEVADSTEMPEEPVTKTVYSFANSQKETAINENIIHNITIEAGDKKKLKMGKKSKKTIGVNKYVYDENGSLLSTEVENQTFSGFKVENYTSTDTSVFKISKGSSDTYPTITAVAPGSATVDIIYSYSWGEEKAYYKTSAVITVKEAAVRNEGLFDTTLIRGESITYSPNLLDKTYTYIDENGKTVTETKSPVISAWVSSAPEKVSVENGVARTLLQGTATITLKYKYEFSDGALTCLAKAKVTSNCYTVEGSTIYLQPSVIQDADAAPAINAACAYARDNATDSNPYTIMFSNGTYKLASATLHVYSNTIFDMTKGATLKFAGVGGANESRQLLKLGKNGAYAGESDYNMSVKCAGYNGFRNVTFLGGTFESTNINKSTIIAMAHATNILFDGVTLTGGASMHMMEIAAIDGFTMKNCTFKNFTGSKAISADSKTGRKAYAKRLGNYEALQFDVVASDDCYGGVYMDGTPMKNIEITGCVFDGVPRGLGSHTQLLGSYHDTVNISDNTFKNTTKEAIILLGFKNCSIKNNTITGCGAGIVMENFSYSPTYVLTKIFEGTQDYDGEVVYDVNSEITNNTISITNRGVAREPAAILIYGKNVTGNYKSKRPTTGKVWGDIDKDVYYIGNVSVEENTITTAGYGIHFSCAKNCVAINNTITGANFKTGTSYSGIYASEYSAIQQIAGNTITSMKGNGISVAASSTVTGEIVDNVVKKAGGCAIRLDNAKNELLISNNTLSTKSKTSNVIQITTGSTNKNRVTIENNSISGVTGSKADGIYLGSGTCTMKKNKIEKVNIGIHVQKSNSSYKISGTTYKSVKTKKKIEK